MDIFNCFNIDKECLVSNIITKQMVYEAGNLSSKDKELFTNEVNKMIWEYSLKEENTGFNAYQDENVEYDEIEFIRVVLKEKRQYKKIANILQKLMPYPIVLIFEYDNQMLINIALKRKNRNDEEKNTLEELRYSEWVYNDKIHENEKIFLEALNIKNILVNDFYMLYRNIEKSILIYNTSSATGVKINAEIKDLDEIKALKDNIDNLENEIKTLERKRDKEKQLNKRIDYQMQIKKSMLKREKLIKELNN